MRTIALAGGALLFVATVVCLWAYVNSPCRRDRVKIGTSDWPEFVVGTVGNRDSYFEGVDVQCDEMDDGSLRRAFRDGALDAMTLPLVSWVNWRERGLEGKIVLVTSESNGHDGIISRPTITSWDGLRGGRVGLAGVEHRYLLHVVLKGIGSTLSDVETVAFGNPGYAADELMCNGLKLDAVVTREPHLMHVNYSDRGHVLVTTTEIPDRLIRVLVASPALLDRRNLLQRLVLGWLRSSRRVAGHREDVVDVLEGPYWEYLDKRDIEGMNVGVRFADERMNRRYFSHNASRLERLYRDAERFWIEEGEPVTPTRTSEFASTVFLDLVGTPSKDER